MTPVFPSQTTSIDQFQDLLLSVDTLAPVGAALGALLLYYILGSQYLGPDDDFWRPIRALVLPQLDKLFAHAFGGYALNNSRPEEFVGTIDMTVDEFERELWAKGFVRNPWSGLKRSPDRRFEASSWALRRVENSSFRAFLDVLEQVPVAGDVLETIEALLATRQIHVTLYATVDGGVDVFAHEEANSVSPLVAGDHYRGTSQDVEKGVAWVRSEFFE